MRPPASSTGMTSLGKPTLLVAPLLLLPVLLDIRLMFGAVAALIFGMVIPPLLLAIEAGLPVAGVPGDSVAVIFVSPAPLAYG